ncbi:MAG: hypothetical protein ACT4R6_06975 [Gemmatimonadaceae bacterium]
MKRWPVCAAALAASACIDYGTDPNEIGAISFDGIAYPAVVAGDTLRDETGLARPLRATVFSGAGDTVANPKVQFFSRDTTVILTTQGYVIGRLPGIARLFATADKLQSITRDIDVVPRPVAAALVSAPDSLLTSVVDTTRNVSADFALRVTSAARTGVKGFLVRYTLEYRGAPVAPGDTAQIFLVDESGRPSSVDTTDTNGEARRRVRVKVGRLPSASDSAVVRFGVVARGYPAVDTVFVRVLKIRPSVASR